MKKNRVHISGIQALYDPECTIKSCAPGGGTVNDGTVTSMDGYLPLKDINMSRSKDN